MSGQSITLKWGSLKAWNGLGDNEAAMSALKRYHSEPVYYSVAMQQDTPAQKQAILDLIDAVNGEIREDWSGKKLSKDEAKAYVQGYRRED